MPASILRTSNVKRTLANENGKPALEFELEKVVRGFLQPELSLNYIPYFVLFEQEGDALIKKIAGYHQFHGVREAVRVTLIAAARDAEGRIGEERATYGREVVPGSRKAGVFWHTQGSGKSIFMCCTTKKLRRQLRAERRTKRRRCNLARLSRTRRAGAGCKT